MTRVERRDPNANYHKMTAAELAQLDAGLRLAALLHRRREDATSRRSTCRTRCSCRAVDSLLTTVPLDDWKAYLRWKVIDAAAPSLSSAFVNEDFSFSQHAERRQGACCRATSAAPARPTAGCGDALGQAYVAAVLHARREGSARWTWCTTSSRCSTTGMQTLALDERHHQGAGDRQAGRVHQQDRLSRQVARLLDAHDQAADRSCNNADRGRASTSVSATSTRSASRSIAPSGA